MYKKAIVTIAAMMLAISSWAQWRPASEVDTWSDRPDNGTWGLQADTAARKWDFHFSTGTTFMSVGRNSNAYMWVAPRASYRASDRLTVHGGFAAVGSLLGGYELQGRSQSLLPVRRGTKLGAAKVGVEYRVDDRLSLWASVSHVGGWHESLWFPTGESLPVGVTTLSGGFSYAFSDASLLEMHFHIVHDHYGNNALGLFGHPYYGYGVPNYELYCGPWPW